MCVFLFLIIIIIIIVIYFFLWISAEKFRDEQKKLWRSTRAERWNEEKKKTVGLRNRMTKAIFDLDYPFWQLSKNQRIYPKYRKKCCLKPTFKCIFHIRCALIKQSDILGVSMLFRQATKNWANKKKKHQKQNNQHKNRNQKNVFIEDCTFVAAAAKFIISFT